MKKNNRLVDVLLEPSPWPMPAAIAQAGLPNRRVLNLRSSAAGSRHNRKSRAACACSFALSDDRCCAAMQTVLARGGLCDVFIEALLYLWRAFRQNELQIHRVWVEAMKRHGLTRRAFLGGALCIPAIHAARADCSKPALRIRVGRDFETFDPADAWGQDAAITQNLLAPLVRFKKLQGSNGWGWEPHIVQSISEGDPRHYKFVLRDEGWRGSSSVSTEDVAFSFERIAGLSGGVANAANKKSWSGLSSIVVANPRTATIKLKSDRADLLTTTLPGVAGCVVNKSYASSLSGGRFTLDPGPTSGRYDLCEVTPGKSATLTKDTSWKGDKVAVDSAQFLVIKDDSVAQEMWLNRQIDVYRPGPDVLQVAVQQGQQVVRAPTSRTSILVLSQQGPLANPELRRAIQLAVDRRAVAQSAYADPEPAIATGLVPQGWPGWSEEELVAFNPEEAKRFVANNQVDTLRIGAWAEPLFIRIAEQVRNDLEKIGLRSQVVPLQQGQFWYAIAGNAADMLVVRTVPQTSGALAAFEDFTSSSPLGWSKNPEFDSLFQQTTETFSSDSLLQLQRLLVDSGVVVPMVDDRAAYLLAQNVRPSFDPDGDVGDLGSWGI